MNNKDVLHAVFSVADYIQKGTFEFFTEPHKILSPSPITIHFGFFGYSFFVMHLDIYLLMSRYITKLKYLEKTK